jgi:hypothetical protein
MPEAHHLARREDTPAAEVDEAGSRLGAVGGIERDPETE